MKRFIKGSMILSWLFLLAGCGGGKTGKQNASLIQPPNVFATLQAGSPSQQADGSFIVPFTVSATGGVRYRFTPTGMAAVNFADQTQYQRSVPAAQTTLTETGMLEAFDANGASLSKLQLQAGPILLGGGGTPPNNTPLCSNISVNPSVIALPVSATGVVLGDAIADFLITTSENATLVQILENNTAIPATFTVGGTGALTHSAQVRYRAKGNSSLTLRFTVQGGTANCSYATTIVTAIPAAPQCVLSASAARVVANYGKGDVSFQLSLAPTSGPVSDLSINGIKLLPAQSVLNLSLPVGVNTIQGTATGPGGFSTCVTQVEVYQLPPTCELIASAGKVLPLGEVMITLVHKNAAQSAPLTTSNIDGVRLVPGDNIVSHPFFRQRYVGQVTSALGTGSCSITVDTGF